MLEPSIRKSAKYPLTFSSTCHDARQASTATRPPGGPGQADPVEAQVILHPELGDPGVADDQVASAGDRPRAGSPPPGSPAGPGRVDRDERPPGHQSQEQGHDGRPEREPLDRASGPIGDEQDRARPAHRDDPEQAQQQVVARHVGPLRPSKARPKPRRTAREQAHDRQGQHHQIARSCRSGAAGPDPPPRRPPSATRPTRRSTASRSNTRLEPAQPLHRPRRCPPPRPSTTRRSNQVDSPGQRERRLDHSAPVQLVEVPARTRTSCSGPNRRAVRAVEPLSSRSQGP